LDFIAGKNWYLLLLLDVISSWLLTKDITIIRLTVPYLNQLMFWLRLSLLFFYCKWFGSKMLVGTQTLWKYHRVWLSQVLVTVNNFLLWIKWNFKLWCDLKILIFNVWLSFFRRVVFRVCFNLWFDWY
jgi:hypothetical protein